METHDAQGNVLKSLFTVYKRERAFLGCEFSAIPRSQVRSDSCWWSVAGGTGETEDGGPIPCLVPHPQACLTCKTWRMGQITVGRHQQGLNQAHPHPHSALPARDAVTHRPKFTRAWEPGPRLSAVWFLNKGPTSRFALNPANDTASPPGAHVIAHLRVWVSKHTQHTTHLDASQNHSTYCDRTLLQVLLSAPSSCPTLTAIPWGHRQQSLLQLSCAQGLGILSQNLSQQVGARAF